MIFYIKILESTYQFLKNKKGSARTVITTTLFLLSQLQTNNIFTMSSFPIYKQGVSVHLLRPYFIYSIIFYTFHHTHLVRFIPNYFILWIATVKDTY